MSLLYNCYLIKFLYWFFKSYFKVINNHAVPIKCCSLKFWIISNTIFSLIYKFQLTYQILFKTENVCQTIIVRGQSFQTNKLNTLILFCMVMWQKMYGM